jgi:predicted SAM-dependent methyltransferase
MVILLYDISCSRRQINLILFHHTIFPGITQVSGKKLNKFYMIKLHLGCGTRIIPGYLNVDIQNFPGVDLLSDLRALPFEDNSVDFIYSCAAIEHFGRREWRGCLAHWHSKLKSGGTLRLSTADFHSVCSRYLKVGDIEELLGFVVGGQKNDYDWHGMIFDFYSIAAGLKEIGFTNIRRYNWLQTELSSMNFDDYSQAYLPHMDKKHGQLMMLNVEADKP